MYVRLQAMTSIDDRYCELKYAFCYIYDWNKTIKQADDTSVLPA